MSKMTNDEQDLLVEADGLSIAMGGHVMVRELAFRLATDDERTVAGGPGSAALDALLDGTAQLVKGSLSFGGMSWRQARNSHLLTVAPRQPVVLPGVTVLEQLTLSFSMQGLGSRRAKHLASKLSAELPLEASPKAQADKLEPWQQRILGIAQCLVPEATMVWVQHPIDGLTPVQSSRILETLGYVARQRKLVVTTTSLDASSASWPLIQGATHVLWLGLDGTSWRGTPQDLVGDSETVWLEIHGDVQSTQQGLSREGVRLVGTAPRFVGSIPVTMNRADLLAKALAYGGTIVEMLPIHPGRETQQAQSS